MTPGRLARASALVAALVCVTSCAAPIQRTTSPAPSASSASVTASASPSASASLTPSATTSSSAVDRLVKGGLLRLPITALPTTWNPLSAEGATPDADAVRGPLSAPAFVYDVAGEAEPNPDVITDVTVVQPDATGASASPTPAPSRPPGTVVTLTLNPKAVWGDGTLVTASDWIATWQALTNARNATRPHPGWERVASVTQGRDDHEVVVSYTGRDPDWTEPLAAGPARAASISDPVTVASGWGTYRPDWFAGPYIVAHSDAKQGVLTLEPNPRWWGSPPHLSRIFFRTTWADAVAADMAAGGFDLYSPAEVALLAQSRTAADSTVRVADGATGRVLTFAGTGVLGDRDVRRALVQGIDRAKLARAVLDGSSVQGVVWSNHLLLPQQGGYGDMSTATGLSYDPTAAADALTKAGLPLVDGVRRGPTGPLTLTVGVRPGDARAAAEASALTADLTALGIGVAVVPGAADLAIGDVTIGRHPLARIGARFPDAPGLAPLLPGLETTTDAAARAGRASAVARLLWQDARTLPLYVIPVITVSRTRLSTTSDALASVDWTKVGYTP